MWDFASIADNFLVGIVLFFICAIAAPHATDGEIDLEAYYQHARTPFYWLIIASMVLTGLGNLDFMKSSDPTQFWTWTIASVAGAIPSVLAIATSSRWAQWTAAVLFTLDGLATGLMLGNLR